MVARGSPSRSAKTPMLANCLIPTASSNLLSSVEKMPSTVEASCEARSPRLRPKAGLTRFIEARRSSPVRVVPPRSRMVTSFSRLSGIKGRVVLTKSVPLQSTAINPAFALNSPASRLDLIHSDLPRPIGAVICMT